MCLQLRAEPLIHRPAQLPWRSSGAVRTLRLKWLDVICTSWQYLQGTFWQQDEQTSPKEKIADTREMSWRVAHDPFPSLQHIYFLFPFSKTFIQTEIRFLISNFLPFSLCLHIFLMCQLHSLWISFEMPKLVTWYLLSKIFNVEIWTFKC